MLELFAEACRLKLLRGIEEQLGHCGYSAVAGVDEVGRGALAGPVVAAAAIPRTDCVVPGVDDSKRLTPAERELLAGSIRRACHASAVAFVEAAEIDRINILEATRLAMLKAIAALDPGPDFVVIDAVRLPRLGLPHLPVVRGDSVSYAVACASILAKVERDRFMTEQHSRYPQYGFAAHKGYGAPEHLTALASFGPSPLHRLTFRSVLPRPAAPARRGFATMGAVKTLATAGEPAIGAG